MKVIAKLNYLHISPRKVRSVVGVVKGLKPKDALAQLRFVPNRASEPLFKLIKSAIANAENNFSLETDSLKISEFKVDGGPVFKRFRPGSRGRSSPLKKKTSHVTLVLEGQRVATSSRKSAEEKAAPIKEVATDEVKTVRTDKEGKREDIFKAKHVPVKKTGFVKKMFQRKSI
ncbi:MAG: 50S ribosomal protein L22 [Candidatus Sungbacteria bacterium]|uniref:Large ribosomal subunit protein uL22 n=1 Tax=Candidatus Sungiibacteriota bacterium TaxID=2750080 RepID=A0A931YD30_9BACT|nr:50S ribosomal protein L22 [Candidatus Sungbacteria bacterium]